MFVLEVSRDGGKTWSEQDQNENKEVLKRIEEEKTKVSKRLRTGTQCRIVEKSESRPK